MHETVTVFYMTKELQKKHKNFSFNAKYFKKKSVICNLSHDISNGQDMSKVSMSALHSDRTRMQCSLQGCCTRVCCVHSGTKAWHRNKCTSREQFRLTSGMKCCK